MKKPAFTLAEILITLGIIGIVAALTIPALMQKTNNKELVSGTLKMGTTLSNALKSMEAHDMVGVDKLADLSTFDLKFKAQLKTRNCTDHSVCLADGSYFDYTEDGFGGVCDKETPCVKINADINGRKGPNKAGKDQYTFLVTYKGIVPMGETETCSGLDCTAYVLAHHKLWEGETTQSNTEPINNGNKTCPEGYELTSGGACSEIAACSTRDGEGNCTSCQSDHFLSDKGVCVSNFGCLDSSGGKCTQCDMGYILKNGYCINNINSDGASEDGGSECSLHSISVDGFCASNTGCRASSNGKCTQCVGGAQLVNGICVWPAGSNGCAESSNGQCTQCRLPGMMVVNGVCIENDGCTEFSNGQCNQCEDHHILKDGICVQNDGCLASSNGQCTQCDENSFLADGVCIYTSGCKKRKNGQCTQCYSGYSLDNGVCKLDN